MCNGYVKQPNSNFNADMPRKAPKKQNILKFTIYSSSLRVLSYS